MKKIWIVALFCFAFAAPQAQAVDISVSPEMQACTNDGDCVIADPQCGNSCGYLPLNAQSLSALQAQKKNACGDEPQESICKTYPPLTANCIHGRCTIGTAYKMNGDTDDYNHERTEAPAEKPSVKRSELPKSFDDRHGYTAYDMPDQGHATVKPLGNNSQP